MKCFVSVISCQRFKAGTVRTLKSSFTETKQSEAVAGHETAIYACRVLTWDWGLTVRNEAPKVPAYDTMPGCAFS